jgi:hypothetical protein
MAAIKANKEFLNYLRGNALGRGEKAWLRAVEYMVKEPKNQAAADNEW